MGIGLQKNKTSVALEVEGAKATGTVTIINNTFDAGDLVAVNGVDFEESVDWNAGGTIDLSAAALGAAINASTDARVKNVVTASVVTDTVTLNAYHGGTEGNLITLAETDGGTDNFTLSGALLAGGTYDEGSYVAESDGSHFIEILADGGLELVGAKELLERNNLTDTQEQVAARVGQKELTGSIGVELKSGDANGVLAETDPLYRSLFGGRREVNTDTITETGNTTTQLNLSDANVLKFSKNDVILVKEAGAYKVHAVTAVDLSVGTANLTILPAAAGAYSDNVVIAKTNVYYFDDNSMTFSATRYEGGEIREKSIGLRSSAGTLNNFATGQLADMSFSVEGLDFDQEVGQPLFDETFDSSLPPVALNACLYVNGVQIHNDSFALSIENALSFTTSICSSSGKLNSRVTNFKVTGSFPAYKEDDDTDLFDIFNGNADASLFLSIGNPSSTTGELEDAMGFWMPQVKFTAAPIGDQEGISTDAIEFQAHRSEGNDSLFFGMM